MSSSPLSSTSPANVPDSPTISSTIRHVVRDGAKNGEELTMRIARTRAEEELGLEAGFLKDDAEWKEKSKSIIQAAFEEPESPVKKATGRKRKSEDDGKGAKKKAKKAAVVEDEEDEDEDFIEEEKPAPKANPKSRTRKAPAKKAVEASDEDALEEEPKPKPKPRTRKPLAPKPVQDSDSDSAAEKAPPPKKKSASKSKDSADSSALSDAPDEPEAPKIPAPPADDDESDMSVLIDEPARPTKRVSKSKSKSKSKPTTKPKPASKARPTADLPPEEAEIKRLQSQLLACGIRKLWHRELAPFPTASKKVSHLKAMLSDAGMTGRYSLEKARAIKEARELKAELESAKEFEAKWGERKEEDGDGDEGAEEAKEAERKRAGGGRVLPKGLVDFGDSGDEGSD